MKTVQGPIVAYTLTHQDEDTSANTTRLALRTLLVNSLRADTIFQGGLLSVQSRYGVFRGVRIRTVTAHYRDSEIFY